ncbi:MAG TPA: PQQ-binding-like beta-propeller repeat protein [Streptosporangiaceae bacterium]|nr:PQQ-binding-like beta-propeller repeat protein [Streptosporangiaceae bacterium]
MGQKGLLMGWGLGPRRTACLLGWAVAGVVGAPPALASHSPGRAGTPSWTVYHDDPAGSGVAAGVGSVDTAARAWTSPTLDGQLYGEPLVLGDLVYVATENDTVYALAAATGAITWSARLGTPVPSGRLPCGNITPTVGISGTPVIDRTRHEIFVVADEMKNGRPAHVLTGLNSTSGQVELSQDVDPPGQAPADILQRTGLTLDDGRVYFGFGGNAEDCGKYRGRLVSVRESGGAPRFFTVDARPGQSQGAIWMGGAAPAVDSRGDLWVATGNGSVSKYRHPYDDSDGILEISPSLRLLQFFAPASWPVDNSDDLDMTTEPILLPDGQVIAAGKSQVVYLLDGRHLGGIGKQQAELFPACGSNIDGGSSETGMIVYLPCLSGIIAVKATSSPPALHMLWSSGVGRGPPIVAGGLVWTIGQNGKLYGLDPATGKIRRQAAIGAPANHFPTPGIGAGLMLAPSAEHVIAFRTYAGAGTTSSAAEGSRPPGPAPGWRTIAEVVIACLVAVGASGWFIWLIRRR